MSLSHSTYSNATVVAAKISWEDPCLVVERDLFARAQGGPSDSEQPWSPQYLLAPMGLSSTATPPGACPRS